MSVTTVLLIVGGLLLLYYAGMISYDLYMDKLKEANAETAKEELIDISDQLDTFDTLDINTPSRSSQPAPRKSPSLACQGLRAEQISDLFSIVAEGSDNETIENLRFDCQLL